MRSTKASAGALIVLGAALCVGCGGKDEGEDRPPERVTTHLEPPPNSTVEEPEFNYEWADIERDDQGRVDAYEKARWITERFNAAKRLLALDVPARVQAGQILEQILRRDPAASAVRLMLAQLRFAEAAYWFQATDAWAFQIDWMAVKKTRVEDGEQGPTLSKEELEEAIQQALPYVEEGNEQIRRTASSALTHFLRYRAARPDDESIADYLWKLYFFLQRYQEAQEWLNYVLAEWERRDQPREDPLYKKYLDIAETISNYLAELELAKESGKKGGPLPWRDPALRAEQRLILSDDRR